MSEIQKANVCVCGKSRDNLNITNWKRHITNCKIKKNKILNRSITSFFPAPKKLRTEADHIDGKFYIYMNYS